MALRLFGRTAKHAPPPPPETHNPVRLDDEYIPWLLLANAGMQVEGNPYLFDLAIRTAPEAPMLEIGSFCGLSTNIIQYLKRKHGRTMPLFTCDKWIFEGSENPLPAAAPISHEGLRAYAKETFKRSVRALSDELPYAVEATSDEFFRAWADRERLTDVFGRDIELGGALGFCFIDGNHQEEYVLRDFQNCDEHLLAGGMILFDDSWEGSGFEVHRVIDRIKRDDRYEVVATNPNYLMRKKG